MMKAVIVQKGGVGSGHHGHAGRPGKVGGSSRSPGRVDDLEKLLRGEGDRRAFDHLDENLDIFFSYNHDTWVSSNIDLRADVKEDIATALAAKMGVDPIDTNNAIAQWAETSNGKDRRSMSLQEAASEEFGTPLSDWQRQQMKRLPTYAASDTFKPRDDERSVNDWSREQERRFLRTMYDSTQAQLQASGYKPGDTITLYRGYYPRPDSIYPSRGDVLDYTGNAMESWSVDKMVAEGFGHTVLAAQFPIENILSTARTGFGCLNEGEFVVLGNSKGHEVLVVKGI